MKFIVFVLMAICLVCCSENPSASEYEAFNPQDSFNFKYLFEDTHRFIKEHKLPDFTQQDTFYLFHMHSGWGTISGWSVLYPDTTGYVAVSDHRIQCEVEPGGYCDHSSTRQSVPKAQWLNMAENTRQANFWKAEMPEPREFCIDCTIYELLIKQGKQVKAVKWDAVATVPDPFRVLVAQLFEVSGRPKYKSMAYYTETRDSILMKILPSGDRFFIKSQTLELENGSVIPVKDEISDIVKVPKEPYREVPRVRIFTKSIWVDGTVEKDMVTVFVKTVKGDSNYDYFFK